MSTAKVPDEKNSDDEALKSEPKKGSGGLFGRLFGRRKKEQDRAPEKVESEAAAGSEEKLPEMSENQEIDLAEAAAAATDPVIAAEVKVSEVTEPEPELKPEFISEPESEVEPDSGLEQKALLTPPTEVEDDSAATAADDSDASVSSAPVNTQSQGLFSRLKKGLAKTRKQFVGTLDNLFYGDKEIDEEFLEELEEILLTSDLGVKTSYRLFSQIEEKVTHKELENPAHLRDFLQNEIGTILKRSESSWEINEKPYVIMTIGVNGVGKTTTIGKLASIFTKQKKKVVLGAADTFRAAAVEQLMVWSERAKVPIVKQSMGADPAAVAFDTVQSAIKREADIVIIDTAGRLHTKVNLMDELKKIQRVLGKALPGAPHEVLLVLDANTGQNAISQAQMFHQEIGVTGLVMTKLDGTAKGGVIVGVCDELKVPVRYIGIGESIADLRAFDSGDFVDALFDKV